MTYKNDSRYGQKDRERVKEMPDDDDVEKEEDSLFWSKNPEKNKNV